MPIFARIAELAAWLPLHKFLASCLIASALGASAVLVRNVGGPGSGRRRRTTMIVLMLLAGLVLALGGSLYLIEIRRWGYLLALLPGATIGRHAVYMRLVRRRTLATPVSPPPGLRSPPPTAGSTGRLEQSVPELSQVFRRARQMQELDFAPDTLAVRFGIPALLTTFIGIGVFEFLWTTHESLAAAKVKGALGPALLLDEKMVTAAWFGAAGAIVYVLLYLGRRAFRADITTGAALWSALVLALGPVFGAVLARIWTGPTQPADWSQEALYFVAGMSPRHVAGAVEEAVRRLWLARAAGPQSPSRLQPLAQLRGVTPEIEDRLGEEGIADVQGMAMADPLKLFRSTSFDKRQILSWMDEAILISWLPEHWATVQKIGVTGAVDLMAQVGQRVTQLRAVLADAAKLDAAAVEAIVLVGVLLMEDAQLQLVWALYQFDDDDLETPPPAEETEEAVASAVPESLAVPGVGWLLSGLTLTLAAALSEKDARMAVATVLPPLAFLMVAFTVALTARWPWPSSRARALPAVVAGALVLVGILARERLSPVLTWQWPVRELLWVAAALAFSLFLTGLLVESVGGLLEIEFANDAPPDTELWVGGRVVPIKREEAGACAACRVKGRRIPVVVRSAGGEERRWVDARGREGAYLKMHLKATGVVQLDPPYAVAVKCWVDGAETPVGPLALWPRALPYSITVEANGFLPAGGEFFVRQADVVQIRMKLQPAPPPPESAPGEQAGVPSVDLTKPARAPILAPSPQAQTVSASIKEEKRPDTAPPPTALDSRGGKPPGADGV